VLPESFFVWIDPAQKIQKVAIFLCVTFITGDPWETTVTLLDIRAF